LIINTLLEGIFSTKSIIVTGLILAVLFTNLPLFSKAGAETGVGKDVFKVIVTLFDITNSTKDITTIVSVKDETKIKFYNAENPETEDQDKVSYTVTFPNLTVDDGEPYTVCTVSTEDFELNCNEGNNSPLNRPEFVDISLSGEGSADQDEGEGSADQDEGEGSADQDEGEGEGVDEE
jgi:hypothetical protein